MTTITLTETDLLLFQKDVKSFDNRLTNIENAIDGKRDDIVDLTAAVSNLCETLTKQTETLEIILDYILKNVNIIKCSNTRIREHQSTHIKEHHIKAQSSNTCIKEEDDDITPVDRPISESRELEPPNIFRDPNLPTPCDTCRKTYCICINKSNPPKINKK